MLPSVQCSPRDTSRVLALEEEGFGFAVLEAEDLAIAADIEFTLSVAMMVSAIVIYKSLCSRRRE